MSLGPDLCEVTSRLFDGWMTRGEEDGCVDELTQLDDGATDMAKPAIAARLLMAVALHQQLAAADASGQWVRGQAAGLLDRLERISGREVDGEWLGETQGVTPGTQHRWFLTPLSRGGLGARAELADRCRRAIALYQQLAAVEMVMRQEPARRFLNELKAVAVFA